jgi:hypothetical protein
MAAAERFAQQLHQSRLAALEMMKDASHNQREMWRTAVARGLGQRWRRNARERAERDRAAQVRARALCACLSWALPACLPACRLSARPAWPVACTPSTNHECCALGCLTDWAVGCRLSVPPAGHPHAHPGAGRHVRQATVEPTTPRGHHGARSARLGGRADQLRRFPRFRPPHAAARHQRPQVAGGHGGGGRAPPSRSAAAALPLPRLRLGEP